MVRRRSCAVSNHESPDAAILREARKSALLRMRSESSPRLQRLVDLDLEHAVEIIRRHRADHLVDDGAGAPDHERLRHAIDPPFDRGAAVAVDADGAERIAVAAEKAPRIIGSVLVVEDNHLQSLVAAMLWP